MLIHHKIETTYFMHEHIFGDAGPSLATTIAIPKTPLLAEGVLTPEVRSKGLERVGRGRTARGDPIATPDTALAASAPV